MAGKKRHSSRRKNKRHRRFTQAEKETMVMMKLAGFTSNEIAAKTGACNQTVEYHYRKAKSDPDEIRKARARALTELAGEMQEKARSALLNLDDESLKHEVVREYKTDKDGNYILDSNGDKILHNVKHFGPTALQIATTVGILQDKANAALDKADVLLTGDGKDALTPDSLRELLASIKNRAVRLQSTTVDIGVEGLVERADAIGTAIEAEYEVLDDAEAEED